MFRVGLQYLHFRITTLQNLTLSRYFPENFPEFWNQLFFVTSSFVLKRWNYMKTRRETRRGGRLSPHFVLINRTEHLYYTRRRRSGKWLKNDLSKHFSNEIKNVLIENFSAKRKPPYFLPTVFFYLFCVYRGIPFSGMLP